MEKMDYQALLDLMSPNFFGVKNGKHILKDILKTDILLQHFFTAGGRVKVTWS
jgi:hypothetical protein